MTRQLSCIVLALVFVVSACGQESGDDIAATELSTTSTAVTVAASAEEGADEDVAVTDSTLTVATTEQSAAQTAETTETTVVPETSRPTQPELTVDVPEEEPVEASVEVLEVGDGPTVGSGDAVFVAFEMVAVGSGEVVQSTADDFGGPIPILIGEGAVPVALEEALDGQTVGSQLNVAFPAGMADLPDDFDSSEAYVLTVQIVDLFGPS